MHTIYRGSDASFHHFHVQHGLFSGGDLVVRREEAHIKPKPFAMELYRHAFIKSAKPGEIELIVIENEPVLGG